MKPATGTIGSAARRNTPKPGLQPVAESAPIVAPWYPRRSDTTLYRRPSPTASWYWCASLIAASIASDPLVQKNEADRSPGVSSASRRASSIVTSLAVP